MQWLREGMAIRARDGAEIWLNKNTWFNHICVNHPELRMWLEEIVNTILDPIAIHKGQNDTHFAYRYSERRGKFIMVLYHKVGKRGRVKTAYEVNDPIPIVSNLMKVYPR